MNASFFTPFDSTMSIAVSFILLSVVSQTKSVSGKRPYDQLTVGKNESFGGRVLPSLDPPREAAADLRRLLLDGTLRRLHPALPPLAPPCLPPSLLQALAICLVLCCLALL